MAELLDATNDLLFGDKESLAQNGDLGGIKPPKHSEFYSALSSIDMALSLQSYWVTFIDFEREYIDDSGLLGDLSDTIVGKLKNLDSQFGGIGATILDRNIEENIPKFTDRIDSNNGIINTPQYDYQGNKQTSELFTKFKKDPSKLMVLVQGVNIPGDRVNVGSTPLPNIGGFIPHPIGGPRQELDRLNISFLENNASIADLIMRPWMISASYDGLKTAKSADIVFFKLARTGSGFKVSKRFDFKHAIPVAIDSEDYNYDPTSNITRRTVEFVYRSYRVTDGEDLYEGLLSRLLDVGLDAGTKYVKNLISDSGGNVLSDFKNDMYRKLKGFEYKYDTVYNEVKPDRDDTIDNAPNRVSTSTVEATETLRTIPAKEAGADTVNSATIPYKIVEINNE